MNRKCGKIIKLGGLNIWPHEQVIANIFAEVGHTVEFIKPSGRRGEKTPDALVDGVKWEMKSPRASSLKAVERNLKRGSWQSNKIIFSSHRMKGIPDKAIERELLKWSNKINTITKVKFVNRHNKIIDIK